MPPNVPALSASVSDVNHLGTFFVEHGGRMAKAAVDFLGWKMKDHMEKTRLFCADSASNQTKFVSPLQSEGWTIRTKNNMCL
jgi:hypothetical protein